MHDISFTLYSRRDRWVSMDCLELEEPNYSWRLSWAHAVCERGRCRSTEFRSISQASYRPESRELCWSLKTGSGMNLISDMSIRENIAIGAMEGLFLSQKEQLAKVRKLANELNIVARDLELPVTSLSGGNQQKVVIARCLMRNPSATSPRRADTVEWT